MEIIQTNNLSKSFSDTLAIDNVSINVRKGEIYGFLGLNGAGKTTAIRLMLGMIAPDSGTISLFGQKITHSSKIWNKIGYMVETPYSYPNLSVNENLQVVAHLRGLKGHTAIDKIIDTLQLSAYRNKKTKHLSLGNNQRLGLAKALIHSPELLLLDEPINGLDPAGIVEIRKFLKELVSVHNTTIFLSSHILSEIAQVATRIGIVNNGQLIKEINTSDLEHQIIKKLIIDTKNNSQAIDILRKNNFTASKNESGTIEICESKAINKPEEITTLLVKSGLPPSSIYIDEENLESYFLRTISS